MESKTATSSPNVLQRKPSVTAHAEGDQNAHDRLLIKAVEAGNAAPPLGCQPAPHPREVGVVNLRNQVCVLLYQHVLAVPHVIHGSRRIRLFLPHPVSGIGVGLDPARGGDADKYDNPSKSDN